MADNENTHREECDNGKEYPKDEKQRPNGEDYMNNKEYPDDEKHSREEEEEEEEHEEEEKVGGERSSRSKRSIIEPPLRPGYRRDKTGKVRKVIVDDDILQ